jgi:transposase-like protein
VMAKNAVEDECCVEKKNRGQYFKKYSENDLSSALQEIQEGNSSVSSASKKYGVPYQTLRDRLNKSYGSQHGNTTVLSSDEEDKLEKFILAQAAFGNPLTKAEILKTAGKIANLKQDPTKRFKNETPTHVWLDKFIKRHPKVAKRTPEALGRASAVHSVDDFREYFDSLYEYFCRTDQLYLLDLPERWWNVDETGFELNPMPKFVYAKKGTKTVHNVERGKPKHMVTVTYAVAADGKYMEPLITFKNSLSSLTQIAYASGCKFS